MLYPVTQRASGRRPNLDSLINTIHFQSNFDIPDSEWSSTLISCSLGEILTVFRPIITW